MIISSIVFEDAENTAVVISLNDGRILTTPWQIQSWHRDPVEKWLAEPGNSIDPFIPPDPPTLDDIYDQAMENQRVFKAFALAINDGSIVPGANVSGAALKAAVKAKM